jgi:hemerythrin
MAIEWTEDLSTSVVEIDNQHKEIFKKMDELHLAYRLGKGRTEIEGMIKFLEAYVLEHFEIEEKYMTKYKFPDYQLHKSEHVSFIKTVVKLKNQLEKEGPSLPLVLRTNFDIAEWLKNHIRKVDMLLGDFLKTRICI